MRRLILLAGIAALSGVAAGAAAQTYPPHVTTRALPRATPDNAVPRTPINRQIAAPDYVPHTLAETLGIAYETNPQLTGERAHLRATDEGVPAALAGWRPTIAVSGSYGWAVGRIDTPVNCNSGSNGFSAASGVTQPACFANGVVRRGSVQTPYGTLPPGFNPAAGYISSTKNNYNPSNVQGTITQYLYRGGRTTATTHQAVNSVYAERARLIAEEEQVFSDTVNAYVTVIEDQQLLQLDKQNEQVLGDELRAINDRFRVGELTRTDVAQAEAALAQAIAIEQTAEGNLATANATFVREVGIEPPRDLADPQPLRLPVKSEKEAAQVASQNNPSVVAALFNEAQQKDAIDVAFSALAPTLSVQGTGFHNFTSDLGTGLNSYGAQATLNLSIPIYQGGAEYATIRQARQDFLQAVRQTQDARRAAMEQAVQAWDTLTSSRAAIQSSHVAVAAAQVALEGTERQALIGTATTQDVLIQQQNLLSAQITLVQNVTNLVTSSYGVASAIGRLTARDLGLGVPLYDETAYYKAVRDRLWGTGDYAKSQPGR